MYVVFKVKFYFLFIFFNISFKIRNLEQKKQKFKKDFFQNQFKKQTVRLINY